MTLCVGDEVWTALVDTSERYFAELLEHVRFVGKRGVTLRRVKPDAYGSLELRLPFDCPRLWRSKQEAETWCAEHVGPWHKLQPLT